jgi:hypothetical protein
MLNRKDTTKNNLYFHQGNGNKILFGIAWTIIGLFFCYYSLYFFKTHYEGRKLAIPTAKHRT